MVNVGWPWLIMVDHMVEPYQKYHGSTMVFAYGSTIRSTMVSRRWPHCFTIVNHGWTCLSVVKQCGQPQLTSWVTKWLNHTQKTMVHPWIFLVGRRRIKCSKWYKRATNRQVTYTGLYSLQCESKNPPKVFWHFSKTVGIFCPNFTRLLHVPIYASLQIFS